MKHSPDDKSVKIHLLNYAIRLIVSETELKHLIQVSLDTLADFSGSKEIKLWFLDTFRDSLVLAGKLSAGKIYFPDERVHLKDNSYLDELSRIKVPQHTKEQDSEYYMMPLLGSDNSTVGVIGLQLGSGVELDKSDMALLTILTTLIAVSYETNLANEFARYDALTGLNNRQHFETQIRRFYRDQKLKREGFAITMSKLDQIQKVIERFGPHSIDHILVKTAEVLRKHCAPHSGTVFRLRGSLFATILPGMKLSEASDLFEEVHSEIMQLSFPEFPGGLQVSLSTGMEHCSDAYTSGVQELKSSANHRLTAALQAGRNVIKTDNG